MLIFFHIPILVSMTWSRRNVKLQFYRWFSFSNVFQNLLLLKITPFHHNYEIFKTVTFWLSLGADCFLFYFKPPPPRHWPTYLLARRGFGKLEIAMPAGWAEENGSHLTKGDHQIVSGWTTLNDKFKLINCGWPRGACNPNLNVAITNACAAVI